MSNSTAGAGAISLTEQAATTSSATTADRNNGVTVDLAAGVAIDDYGQQDTLLNIEDISATRYDDLLDRTLAGATGFRAHEGNDTLDGRAGADNLIGGAGDDTYFVDNAGDIVDEFSDGGDGIDTVVSSELSVDLADTTHFLGDIENITLTGGAILNATGNGLNNVINGNAATNVLSGGAGSDTLNGDAGNDRLNGGAGDDTLNGGAGADNSIGGAGDDTYFIDSAGDILDEASGGSGIDTVVSSNRSISLADTTHFLGDIENITLTGGAILNATGNGLNNVINGNAAANVLSGGAGNDTLNGDAGEDTMTGGADNDTFRFDATSDLAVGANADVITDFDDNGNDRIDLSALFGPAMTYLGAAAFTAAGQVRINDIAGADVVVEINVRGSLAADMQIRLTDTTLASMTASDFIL